MSTINKQEKENLNPTVEFNNMVDVVNDTLVKEAIDFFNHAKKYVKHDDTRFFFKIQDVESVMRNLWKPDDFAVRSVRNDDGSFFCYEIYNVKVDMAFQKHPNRLTINILKTA